MAQDAPKRRFLSIIFLVSCILKSFLMLVVCPEIDWPNWGGGGGALIFTQHLRHCTGGRSSVKVVKSVLVSFFELDFHWKSGMTSLYDFKSHLYWNIEPFGESSLSYLKASWLKCFRGPRNSGYLKFQQDNTQQNYISKWVLIKLTGLCIWAYCSLWFGNHHHYK